uniref:Uncharacterized protein n=1 Tax=Candidatus Kentrum sp. TUN TaxID=2126343 RepID=A0A450ZYK6_9GAMM|nr:MAG: hypothetical protein BECKTUN1418D_GA0071000_101419 [Candidatus Kentron sp. TUN]VFK58837.1 MAG: hypothetical protein BECKTUN1418F_GA0071002_11561 [Candidatus Kentron sp. TUN]VFK67531.1 MAG: hypothetical protein BECKTUN1418E_GA0071001_11531 [Candidatus Kentron sp. TUN]
MRGLAPNIKQANESSVNTDSSYSRIGKTKILTELMLWGKADPLSVSARGADMFTQGLTSEATPQTNKI